MVLTARTETMIPLIYMITLLMAYFGPNAEILGTIKLEIWHYDNKIDDIWASLFKIGLLWVVDIFCQICASILMWKYCNVNMFQILLQLQKELWLPMAIGEALLIIDDVSINSFFIYLIYLMQFFFSNWRLVSAVCSIVYRKWPRSYTSIRLDS